MGIKITPFEEIDPFENERPEEPEGMWAIPCPRCGNWAHHTGHCGTCEHSEYGVKGWVLIEAIETQPACKVEDHTYEIHMEGGGGYMVTCLDPHPRNVQEAMLRHDNYRSIPGCMEDHHGEIHDMIVGSFKVKFELVVEGGSYEYPNDVDVWYEITEGELIK